MPHYVRWILAVLLLASVAGPAHADDDDTAKARSLFEKGMAHFQLEEYDAAIDKWQAGFRLKPVPEFLYNIAQAYRLWKQPDKALSFYRKYLSMRPDAPNRPEVERHMRSMERLVNEQERAASAPPTVPMTPNGAAQAPPENPPTSPPPPPAEPPTVAASPAPAPAPTETNAVSIRSKPERPITRRPWFWAVVGGAAAVVVAGVVVGVVVGTRESTSTLPLLRF